MKMVKLWIAAVALGSTAFLAACSKTAGGNQPDPLMETAAATIKKGIDKPEPAMCELRFEPPMRSRNLGLPGGPAFHSLCLPDDAPDTLKNCWNALKEQKVASNMGTEHPDCLWPMNGQIKLTDARASGLSFPCGTFSAVEVTKLDKSEADRLRVTYSLKVEKDSAKLSQIERQCGDAALPPAQEKSVSLFRDGDHWTLPGR